MGQLPIAPGLIGSATGNNQDALFELPAVTISTFNAMADPPTMSVTPTREISVKAQPWYIAKTERRPTFKQTVVLYTPVGFSNSTFSTKASRALVTPMVGITSIAQANQLTARVLNVWIAFTTDRHGS